MSDTPGGEYLEILGDSDGKENTIPLECNRDASKWVAREIATLGKRSPL